MGLLHALMTNKAWVAHLLGLGTLTAAEASKGDTNPILLAAVTFITSVFHICDTLKAVKTTSVRVDMTPPDAPFGTPHVDATVPPLTSAPGDQPITS